MSIPYRTQQGIKRFFIVLLVLSIVAIVAFACWMLWLHRFVVYDRDEGALLNFELEPVLSGEPAAKPQDDVEISIYYNEGDNVVQTSKELTKLSGYYVDATIVRQDPRAVMEQLKQLPAGTTVLVDVKNISGYFYYSSTVSELINTDMDVAAMDELIEYLDKSGLYTIARLPAFRDREYGRRFTYNGLPVKSGGYLWMDNAGAYWLNPTREVVIERLGNLATELRLLGFDEVMFSYFEFPATDNIRFDGDKPTALADAAAKLVQTCATEDFAVSFSTDGSWTPPEGRSRVYVVDADPIDVELYAERLGLTDNDVNLVFLTALHDTRFEEYSVLRPITTMG